MTRVLLRDTGVCVSVCVCVSCLVVSESVQPHRLAHQAPPSREAHVVRQEKGSHRKPRGEALGETTSASALILDLQPPDL